MFKVFFLSMEIFILSFLIFCLGLMVSMKSFQDLKKKSPFECGFSPRLSSRIPFSLQFFLVALIFVIFDIELILLYPFLLFSKIYFDTLSLLFLVLFIFLLTFGLLAEWNLNMLDWVS